MWLARTAIIELADPPPPMLGRHPFLATNGCTVVVGAIGGAEEFDTPPDDRSRLTWPFEGEAVTVGVSVTVGTSLPELIAGRLRVPDEPRERAEAAIDEYADMLAVTYQCRRIVRSPMAGCVAMAPASDAERSALTDVTELHADRQGYPMARVLPTLAPSALQPSFGDRPDAVALLADAQSEANSAARAREYFRLLERAFTEGSTKLVDPLTEFLASHPRQVALGYGRGEVEYWLTTLRAETVHGDKRSRFARAVDVQPYLGRLEVAAYDVVFNKANWRQIDAARRDGQTLLSAVQPDARSIVFLDPRAAVRNTWRDLFGRYPTDWKARVSMPPGWIWAGPGQRDDFDREKAKKAGWDLY